MTVGPRTDYWSGRDDPQGEQNPTWGRPQDPLPPPPPRRKDSPTLDVELVYLTKNPLPCRARKLLQKYIGPMKVVPNSIETDN